MDWDFHHHHQEILDAIAASEKRIMAAIDDIITKLQGDLTALNTEVQAVLAALKAGQPVTQAQIDALTAVSTGIESATTQLAAVAPPPA